MCVYYYKYLLLGHHQVRVFIYLASFLLVDVRCRKYNFFFDVQQTSDRKRCLKLLRRNGIDLLKLCVGNLGLVCPFFVENYQILMSHLSIQFKNNAYRIVKLEIRFNYIVVCGIL